MNRINSSAPRYEHRFRNGVHTVFDTIFYAPVDTRQSEKAAQTRADELNTRHAERKPQVGRAGVRK